MYVLINKYIYIMELGKIFYIINSKYHQKYKNVIKMIYLDNNHLFFKHIISQKMKMTFFIVI